MKIVGVLSGFGYDRRFVEYEYELRLPPPWEWNCLPNTVNAIPEKWVARFIPGVLPRGLAWYVDDCSPSEKPGEPAVSY